MREQEIKEIFTKEYKERQQRAWNLISEKHKKAFQKKLEEVLKQFYKYQKEDETKKLKYVCVNCLGSSVSWGKQLYHMFEKGKVRE